MPDLSLLPPSAAIDGEDLRIGGCLLAQIAADFGTPAYVVDEQALRDRAAEYTDAMTSRHGRSRVCFAVKAFPSVAMIKVLVESGLGCDVVGGGELRAGPRRRRRPSDDRHARQRQVRCGHRRLPWTRASATSSWMASTTSTGSNGWPSRPTPVLLRVSPGVESTTHAALATGGKASKFGVPVEQVPEAIARMRAVPAIDLRGLHAHIGSQILGTEQFEAAVDALASLERFEVYDFGGGLGVRYVPEDAAPTRSTSTPTAWSVPRTSTSARTSRS